MKKTLNDIVKFDKKNRQVSNLVDRFDEKTLISSLPNPFTSFFNSTFQSLIAVLTTNFIAKLDDENYK